MPDEYIGDWVSDEDGRITAHVEPGTYEIELSGAGYWTRTVTVVVTEDGASETVLLTDREQSVTEFDYETFLEDGSYTFVVDHPDFWSRVETVSVSGLPLRQDFSLREYGDAIDTTGLTLLDSLETDDDGAGTFDPVAEGEYVLEFSHEDYQTKTLATSHEDTTEITTQLEANDVLNPPREGEITDPTQPPEAGEPEGFDPGLNLPDGDSHFECAVLDTDTGGDYQVPVLVTNAGGSEDATWLRIRHDRTDELIDWRSVTLVPGGYTIVDLSVRSLVNSATIPAPVTVSTLDDSETFELTSTIDPRPITGPGLPTDYGMGATYGQSSPATYGPMREPPQSPDRGFPESGWALVLQKPNGDRRVLTDLTSSPDIEDVHTKASSWSVSVPGDRNLREWNFDTRAFIVRDGHIANIGWCDSVESSSDGQETTLSGPGPFGELPGDDITVEINQMVDWRAGQYIVDEVAPEWDITVLRTDDTLTVTDESYSGNPLSILTSFCEDYGLYFRPSATHFRQGTIFEPGGVASQVDLNPTSLSVDESSEGYANEVTFEYADGQEVTVPNEDEIRRLARARDLRLDDARETIRVEDGDVEGERTARERAKGELRERVTNYESGGSIEMPARRIQPGLAYPMPFDDETRHSARAVRFDGDGYIDLPERMFDRLAHDGAIAVAVKAGQWSDLTRPEGRLFGAWGNGPTIRVRDDRMVLRVQTDTDRLTWGDPFQDVPDPGWYLIHYDWEYDENEDMTTLRAGRNGTIADVETVGGKIATEGLTNIALGRFGEDYLRETILESAWFYSAPQSAERYAALNRGESAPATDLVARYRLDETPGESTAYDSVGGWHGEKIGTQPAGRPVTLDSASHSLTTTSGEFNRRATLEDALRQIANR